MIVPPPDSTPLDPSYLCLHDHEDDSLLTVSQDLTSLNSVLQVSEEVQEALHGATKKPVIALETAIYTHGFPYPENVALSSRLESIVRMGGGVPATVGIVDGIARVGMDPEELIRLSQSAGKKETLKISRRDLAYACGSRFLGPDQQFVGGTTIAGTMVLAHLAGIKVFATGGLGGVHRDGENTLDISADLTELGRTPVTVISSGCKSFLDIPRTLEYLETQGVAVGTFADGRDGPVDFPGFWSRDSGSNSPQVVRDELHAAAMIHAQHSMGLSSGMLLANPIPSDAEIPLQEISAIIKDAVDESYRLGISGAKNTPFVLAKILELTQGKSLKANEALISSNVARATLVAKNLLQLEADSTSGRISREVTKFVQKNGFVEDVMSISDTRNVEPSSSSERFSQSSPRQSVPKPTPVVQPDIVVAGSLAIDTTCDYIPRSGAKDSNPYRGTSNMAKIRQNVGGVGHNVALAAHYYGKQVRLVSAVGNDLMGQTALNAMQKQGMPTHGVSVIGRETTAQYVAINDALKDLHFAMADMEILTDFSHDLDAFNHGLRDQPPSWFVVDCNWFKKTLLGWLLVAKSHPTHNILTALEPVSGQKSSRFFTSLSQAGRKTDIFPRPLVDLATPNALELEQMWKTAENEGFLNTKEHWAVVNAMNLPQGSGSNILRHATSSELVSKGVPQQAMQLLPYMPTLAITLGEQGVLLAQLLRADDARLADPAAAPYVVARSGNVATTHNAKAARDLLGGVYMRLFPPPALVSGEGKRSVNGAGDTFMGVLVAALAGGARIDDAVAIGQAAAGLTLRSLDPVSPAVTRLAGRSVEDVGRLAGDSRDVGEEE
ncbi:Indigoidine synthase A like protein-domain-containing protein [Phyllosticta capitalensis]